MFKSLIHAGTTERLPPEAIARYDALRKIGMVADGVDMGRRGGPRKQRATILALLSGVLTAVIFYYYAPVIWLSAVLIVVSVMVAVNALFMACSGKPLTYDDELDRLLAEYDPLDKSAYRSLQSVTVEASGFIPIDLALRPWIERERAAIDASCGIVRPARMSFVDKSV